MYITHGLENTAYLRINFKSPLRFKKKGSTVNNDQQANTTALNRNYLAAVQKVSS